MWLHWWTYHVVKNRMRLKKDCYSTPDFQSVFLWITLLYSFFSFLQLFIYVFKIKFWVTATLKPLLPWPEVQFGRLQYLWVRSFFCKFSSAVAQLRNQQTTALWHIFIMYKQIHSHRCRTLDSVMAHIHHVQTDPLTQMQDTWQCYGTYSSCTNWHTHYSVTVL